MTGNATRSIELLSPARNADTGIEAIRHGADAVYIGAPKFGAREAAANSIEYIKRLTDYAHVFNAKVYATLNTILYDSELQEAREMACRLFDVGVDALIVQDAAFLEMRNLPPIALHASTQCDNRTPEKVKRLYEEGFSTAVLARELSLEEINEIHKQCPEMRLEAFIHGALCVSMSGRCYASQHCFGRSANRGECAQFCRLPFDLETENGVKIIEGKHLLSLRDLNRTDYLEQLLDAGVSSLKIEGRLKDVEYVKNITAWYRRKLDAIFAKRKEYVRASAGKVALAFEPKPEKSFNRGFTDYFMQGRTMRLACPATPKSIGEPVGEVREVGRCLIVSGHKKFANGDGLCFFTDKGELRGFRVNRAEGTRLFPAIMPKEIKNHTGLFRNHDEAFSQMLSKPSAERTLKVDFNLAMTENGFMLSATDELLRHTDVPVEFKHEKARNPQRDNIVTQLTKLGGTCFSAGEVKIENDEYFIPSSLLSDARRKAVASLLEQCGSKTVADVSIGKPQLEGCVDYSANVANKSAEKFYKDCGAERVEPAWELKEPENAPVMTCRYCLRNEIGMCLKRRDADRSYLFLRLADGRRFRLDFDCKNCIMKIYAEE